LKSWISGEDGGNNNDENDNDEDNAEGFVVEYAKSGRSQVRIKTFQETFAIWKLKLL
jgi:hypothetical protein